MKKLLADYLFSVRRIRGLSLREAGEKLGYGFVLLSHYESATSMPTDEELKHIAEIYEVSFDTVKDLKETELYPFKKKIREKGNLGNKYECKYCNAVFDKPKEEMAFTSQGNFLRKVCPICSNGDYKEIKNDWFYTRNIRGLLNHSWLCGYQGCENDYQV